ncbi:hypothetical protein [Ottowia oryzae]|uniref:DUF4145 domain-containing protein n=1 Tax=Ottowia oryzae TaxID=2109914 RepID=A0A2S0MHS0_9BURK|nr:hypothetical protein [Ottowia oryzae]AVO35430.1 hypothetical protein C6570_15270 [Ottowia oryzae]
MTLQYLLQGVVLPERAQLSLGFSLGFSQTTSHADSEAHISIILNQIAVTVESSHEWDIFDLRNVVLNLVRGQLDAIGYLIGHAYDLEITRVINLERSIDYVFGIDMPCISCRGQPIDLAASLIELRGKLTGFRGIFLHRCFADLVSAMKNAEDTGFYCYRALESLRHHCAAAHDLSNNSKKAQWEKFRQVASTDRESIEHIKAAADPARHGEAVGITGERRAKLLTATWNIVDSYLAQVVG